ncbi:MAG: formyltransferase [Acidiferrobacteraceae bacterium]
MISDASIVVFGYHDVGAACLDLLLQRGERVAAVFTHEDDPREEIWWRSVRDVASAAGVPVYTPGDPNDRECAELVRRLRPGLIFSFYYRRMLGPDLLGAARGAFNMHGSLLPRYRGRAPVNWAIVNGEMRTGATLHAMVRKPDAGAIVDQEAVPIGPRDTARQVFDRVTAAACRVLARSIDPLKEERAIMRPQDESQASYFGGRTPEDGRIDWTWPASRIFNLIRAVTHPYPGAFTTVRGHRLFLWWGGLREGHGRPGEILSLRPLVVAAGRGAIELVQVQWEREVEVAAEAASGLDVGLLCGD